MIIISTDKFSQVNQNEMIENKIKELNVDIKMYLKDLYKFD